MEEPLPSYNPNNLVDQVVPPSEAFYLVSQTLPNNGTTGAFLPSTSTSNSSIFTIPSRVVLYSPLSKG